ncbi:MAG: VOC family protein [Pseudobacteriovorax sp.]|nr:VOC family protein [Pseudobacteriovorax sp.]
MKPPRNRICLMYDKDAEEAAQLYATNFPDSSIGTIQRAPSDNPSSKEGEVLVVEFSVLCIANPETQLPANLLT